MSDFAMFVTLAFLAGVYLATYVCGKLADAKVNRVRQEYDLKLARAGLLLRRAQVIQAHLFRQEKSS